MKEAAMAIHLKRAPWDQRPVCGRGGRSETTFDEDKATCKLCKRSIMAADARTLHDNAF
jgi:hypothetical protein